MALPCPRAASVLSLRPEPRKLPPLPLRRAVIIAEKASLESSKNHHPRLEITFPRRGAMACMAASLVASFFLTEPAEAGRIKPETRRKIREKLDKMKEKGGVPNKPDSGAPGKEMPPAVLNNLAGPLVEATF